MNQLNDFLMSGHDGFASQPMLAAACIAGIGMLIAIVAWDIGRWSETCSAAAAVPALDELDLERATPWDPLDR